MHDIEPHFKWRDKYIAANDAHSPFYGKVNSEFAFSQQVYNYFIHPQWDDFGSSTLYMKLLFVEYEEGFAILEMLGEWNDCLHNDIMFLKRDVIDPLISEGVYQFILICENVLNFHAGDDDYYEEWQSDVIDEGGWISFINTSEHIEEEMKAANIQYYAHFGSHLQHQKWRMLKPQQVVSAVRLVLENEVKKLRY